MNNKKSKRLILWALQITVICAVGSIAGICAQAQCPSPVNSNPNLRRIGLTIANMRTAGATVTCSSMTTDSWEVDAEYPNGMWASIRMSSDASTNTTIWDPETGRLTTFYYTWSGSGVGLIIDDSVNGLINAYDGWYSIWDPLGNPFNAAYEDPLNALTLWTAVIQDPDAGGDYRVPPAPIEVEGGIY